MALILDQYIRVLDAVRAEWPELFKGFEGQPRTVGEIRFISARLGLPALPKPDELLNAATRYLAQEKEPEPVKSAVKSTPQATKNDFPASAVAGSW